jgi:hypothetical protein
VGAECVYSVRSSKQLDKAASESQENGRTRPVTPAMSHEASGLGTFEPESLNLDDVFSNLPSPWDTMGIQPVADHALPPTHSGSTSIITMSTGGTFSSGSLLGETAVRVPNGSGSPDPSTRLTSVCQTLEAMFKKVTSGPTNAGTYQCTTPIITTFPRGHMTANTFYPDPVAEFFDAFEGFLRTLEQAGTQSPSRASHTPFDEYMDSKQAALAAQCYMLCVKLMVSLSEKMLQNLLSSPMSAQHLPFSLGTPESAQMAGGMGAMGAMEVNFTHPNQNSLENIRVEDLYIGPTDTFEHALHSIVNMLRVGTRLLGRMEMLLEIPPDLAGGTMTFPNLAEQTRVDQQMKRSLAARLVRSTWEHETSIGSKCLVTYFRRYRAAILGLAQGHI